MPGNQGPSVFPITLPTVLGDTLRLSPSTVGSPDWFPEWLGIKVPSVFPIALPTVLGDTLMLVEAKFEASEKCLKRGSRGLSTPGSKKPEKESKIILNEVFFGRF